MGGRASDRTGLADLPASSRDRLESLTRLLQKWNPAINLVAPQSLPDVWQRHIADSAQLFAYRPSGAGTWLDLGSGGGFPGLVIAILAKDEAPTLRVELVESDQRKCVFLQTAARDLGLSVTITRSRIEALMPRNADVVSARALARLGRLCRYAAPNLAPTGICLFLKGTGLNEEVAEARKTFKFDLDIFPSAADNAGTVVRIEGLEHV